MESICCFCFINTIAGCIGRPPAVVKAGGNDDVIIVATGVAMCVPPFNVTCCISVISAVVVRSTGCGMTGEHGLLLNDSLFRLSFLFNTLAALLSVSVADAGLADVAGELVASSLTTCDLSLFCASFFCCVLSTSPVLLSPQSLSVSPSEC